MEWIELGKVLKITKGKKVEVSDSIVGEKVRYIQIDDLRNDNNIKYCEKNNKYIYSNKNDLIIAWDGANAGTIGYNLEGAIGSTLAILELQCDYLQSSFIGIFLKSKFNFFQKTATGATIPHINKQALMSLKIPVPSMEVQEKIVQLLDEAQSLINKRKKQIELLDKLTESVFYEMFGDPIRNEKVWKIEKLNNHINVIGGYAFKSTEYREKGIPVIKIGNINRGYFEEKDISFYDEIESLSKYAVYNGDLLMSLTGTVGKNDYGNVCVLDGPYKIYYLNQRNAKLEITGELSTLYLTHLLKVESMKRNLVKVNRGVRQANISNQDILNLEIPVPPLSLQNEFAEKVEAIEKQKELLEKSLRLMEDNYNALMQRAFKGELF